MSRCVILAAGPVCDPAVLKELLLPDDYIIAADGGFRLATAMGVVPHTVVADFDSCHEPKMPETISVVCLPVRKDVTDTAAAAEIGYNLGFRDFLLLGGTGGRLDHQYANTLLIVSLAHRGCRAVLADEYNRIEAKTHSPVKIHALQGWNLSLFAFGDVVHDLCVQGAAYELEQYNLNPTDPLCISNQTENGSCEITFSDGTLLVFYSKD